MVLDLPKKPIKWLIDNITVTNIADHLDEDTLTKIGREVVSGYETDLQSRQDWTEKVEDGLKIAMQVVEEKTFPWPNAANVKFPLIATAAIQFASRAYSEIVRGRDIVHAAVVGDDPNGSKEERAKRISEHMSFQLIDEMPEWEPDTDAMLHILPIVGCHFRKTYYSDLYQRNISEGVLAQHFVVNYKAKSLETCRRSTHEIYLYKNEALEKERFGLWAESGEGDYKGEDKEDQELFLEQYTWFDLDGDGYEEPYIVVVHKDTTHVKRITARYEKDGITVSPKDSKVIAKIDPVEYFTKFSFIPSPDGGFYDIGFAHLLGPLNETMNALLNQLLDAGTLSNMQSGFISKGIRLRSGSYAFKPGEWKVAESTGQVLKDGLVPLPTREPSGVLFQLLGFLNENAMKLASVSETMTGETPGANVPATTVLALIEQGLKVFTSIYKRIFRSLKSEYRKLYRLNAIYLPEEVYFTVLDNRKAVARNDYELKTCDVEPVADPTQASEALRLAKARALMEVFPQFPLPEQKVEVLRRYCEALSVINMDALFPMEKIMAQLSQPPPPNPEMLRVQLDTAKAEGAEKLKYHELQLKHEEVMAKIELDLASAQEKIAKANSEDIGHAFDQRMLDLNKMMHDFRVEVQTSMAGMPQKEAEEPTQAPEPTPETPEMETSGTTPDIGEVSTEQETIAPTQSAPDSEEKVNRAGEVGRPVVLPGEVQ